MSAASSSSASAAVPKTEAPKAAAPTPAASTSSASETPVPASKAPATTQPSTPAPAPTSAPAAVPPSAPPTLAPTSTAQAAPVGPRPEVAKVVASKPVTPPTASGGSSQAKATSAAPSAPKASPTAGPATSISAASDKPVPAATPSPSMVGVQAAVAVGSKASVPSASSAAPAVVPRQAPAQLRGSRWVDSSASTTMPTSSASRQPVPLHAVEITSRAPTLASQGPPPASTPLPSGLAAQGPATMLTQVGRTATPPVSVPKAGPPAVALGRAVARGSLPAVTSKAGKPATEVAKKYQIVFVSAEVAPWSKTGGLGEAMDGLPIALAALGHRVMTVTPRYDQYEEAWDTAYWSDVTMGSQTTPVHAFHAFQSKVDRVFLDHDCFLAKVQGKTGSMLYGPEWGKDYNDNQWRFSYFAKATLKVIKELPLGGSPYGSDVIIFVNDWHAALLPVYLEQEKKADPGTWANTKTAMIIHNALFQGRFNRDDPEQCSDGFLGFSESVLKEFTMQMPLKVGKQHPKVPKCLNWMAGGAKCVDRILTVSPTYAWELLSLPEKSVELEDIFRKKGITGIVNGAKETVSPQSQLFVTKAKMLSTFGPSDVDEKKAELKAYLQEKYGLPVSKETALCVFLGRMDLQKGYDFLLAALEASLATLDLQVVIVGTGRADLVASSKALAKKFPKKMYLAGWMGPERYALVAGADYMLMPSRWEPCGLAQIESMRFGTLPVVAQTGGLVDTVDDMITGVHLGGALSDESILDPASVELMVQGLEKCAALSKKPAQVSQMRKAAMAAGNEFTWSNSALQYEAVAEELGAIDVLPLCKDNLVTLEVDKVVS